MHLKLSRQVLLQLEDPIILMVEPRDGTLTGAWLSLRTCALFFKEAASQDNRGLDLLCDKTQKWRCDSPTATDGWLEILHIRLAFSLSTWSVIYCVIEKRWLISANSAYLVLTELSPPHHTPLRTIYSSWASTDQNENFSQALMKMRMIVMIEVVTFISQILFWIF